MYAKPGSWSCLPTSLLTILVLLCLAEPFPAAALDPSKSVSQYNCKNWTRDEGLPGNRINAITQTSDGYLWLGTQKGLARFDGVQFTSVAPPDTPYYCDHIISSLSPLRAGGLWFGLREGAFASYSEGKGFFEPPPQPWLNPRLAVYAIREVGDGSLWIGVNQGAIHWMSGDVGSSQFYTNTSGVWTIYEGPSGRVWLGTVERGIYFWKDGELTRIPDQDGRLGRTGVTALAEDGQGGLWVGTTWGLWHYDAKFRAQQVEPMNVEIKALLVDRQGVLWVGTTGMALARLKDGQLTFFSPSQGMVNENVTALFEDREGSLWVGTRNGLSQLTDLKLPICSAADGILPGGSHAVCAARQGGIWAGMTRGVSWMNGTNFSNYTAESNGLTLNYTKIVFEARNGDLYMIHGNKEIEVISHGKIVAQYLNSVWPTSFTEDRQSVIVSLGDNLFRVTGKKLSPYEIATNNKPVFNWIRNLSSCRDGSVLVSSVAGLFRLTPQGWQHWSSSDGLPDDDVHCAIEDDQGLLWVGTRFGLARIDQNQVRAFTKRDGLYDHCIFAIVPDDQGSLWLNSSLGIFRIGRQDLNDLAEGKIRRFSCAVFDGADAVKSTDTTEVEYSGCKSADGRIWFPSPAGVVIVNPRHLISNPLAPPVHIQQASANGCQLVGGKARAVRPGKGDLEFHYTAPSFFVPQKVRFRYILEGYDRAWVDADSRRSAYYTNLKPGHYLFRVQACNADGIWNTAGDTLDIELPPHFYQTAWFEAMYGVLGLSLMAVLYGWRVRHLHKKQRKLQEANELLECKVRERSRELLDVSRRAGMAEVAIDVLHSVGNALNSVNVSTSLLRERIGRSDVARLQKATALLRDHEQDLAGFLAERETGKQFIAYLESLAQHFGEEKTESLREVGDLQNHVERIKEIVAMQEVHAAPVRTVEVLQLSELMDDALRLIAPECENRGIRVVHDFSETPNLNCDRHKLFQILLNVLKNAVQACGVAALGSREISVRIGMSSTGRIKAEIGDNGIGIPSENLTRIFSEGFTTRKNGHGFSLHKAALAAKEMGGSLRAFSDGPGKGAKFVLELPAARQASPGSKG